jgi:PAS domain S-box-containing protein
MKKKSLFQWLWTGLLKTIQLPIMMMGIVFILTFFLADEWGRKQHIQLDREHIMRNLLQIAGDEADLIERQLLGISRATDMLRKQTEEVFRRPFTMNPEQLQRMKQSSEGVYYTSVDTVKGGAAFFYSAIHPMTDGKITKVQRLFSIEDLMKGIQLSNPLSTAVYFNSYDSLNVIYPYMDVFGQFDPLMDLPKYNFYYEADQIHNPERIVKWTDSYIDPAGSGQMISSIAPVYNGDFLEGVVGIDVTIDTFANKILDLAVPWNGYGILTDNDGKILAMPSNGTPIPDIEGHLDEIKDKDQGVVDSFAGEDLVVAWSTLAGTGWKLILVTPGVTITAHANEISAIVDRMGFGMILLMIIIYSIMFVILYQSMKKLTGKVIAPLVSMKEMTLEIGKGNYLQPKPDYPIREMHDTAVQIVEMGKDLHVALKQMEVLREAAEAAKKNLTSILQSLDDIVFILDEKGIILSIWSRNPDDLAAPAEKMVGLSASHFLDKHLYHEYMIRLKNVFESGNPERIEYRIETKQGWRWRLARVSPIIDSDGILRSVSVLAKDITERKEMESSLWKAKEEAESASKAKSEFLSSMSHELRTPMNAILGYAQLLEYGGDAELSAEQKESVEEILSAGHHLLTLINDILDLSRVESGQLKLDMEIIPLHALAEECLGWIEPLTRSKELSIHHPILAGQNNFEVYADRTRLKEILLNLLSNAVKYNKYKGSISMDYEQDETHLKIHIWDTGIGIPPEELENIFESFYRIKDTPEYVEGTGIGLSLTRQLVELMGGTIHVESRMGEGSRFSIGIPRSAP